MFAKITVSISGSRPPDKAINDIEVALWEDAGTVWVRASTPDVGIPMSATPITDVWDDTGIVPPLPATGLPVSENRVLAVREGLSPLAIKRSPPLLQKAWNSTEEVHETSEQMRRVFSWNSTNSRTYGFRDRKRGITMKQNLISSTTVLSA